MDDLYKDDEHLMRLDKLEKSFRDDHHGGVQEEAVEELRERDTMKQAKTNLSNDIENETIEDPKTNVYLEYLNDPKRPCQHENDWDDVDDVQVSDFMDILFNDEIDVNALDETSREKLYEYWNQTPWGEVFHFCN